MPCGRNLVLWKRRRRVFAVTLTNSDGNAITVSEADNIRMKIGRAGQPSLLDVDHWNETPHGSHLTLENPTTVTIAAGDLDDRFRPGVYDVEFLDIDDVGGGEPVLADLQFVTIHETQEGSVSIDEESSSSSSFSSSSSTS